MLNLPDLNRLKVFQVVYDQRSLVRTANLLGITRSAVSQSLKALEAELQTKLFIRDSKKFLPTEAAEILSQSVAPFIADLRATVEQLETGKKIPTGHLRIGAPQDFGSAHLTDAIVEFCKRHSGITFELTLAIPVTLLQLLSDGKLDIAFVDNGDVHAGGFPVSAVTVMKENFILVTSKRYLEKHRLRGVLKFEDLRALDFIDYLPRAPVSKMWIQHHFAKPAPELRVVFSAESVRALIRATAGGLGVCVLPENRIGSELRSGRLVKIPSRHRELVNQITLARRLGRSVSAKEKLFVEFYRAFIAD